MTILLFIGVAITSYIIWLSSTGISGASEMWGCGWSPGVRGATINAVASSLPELFISSVFLVILGDSEGFVSGLSTVAGSSVFNAFMIPGVMILAVFIKNRRSLKNHDRSLVLRDGLWLLVAQIVVYFIILSGHFSFWHGALLMCIYVFYILMLFMNRKEPDMENCYFTPETRRALHTKFMFGIIGIGAGCYFLVEICVKLGNEFNLGVPIIALIIAAAATSVPDLFLSTRDASKGNTDDAISNVFGSNIFDLCIAIGLPLFIYGLLKGDIILGDSMVNSLSTIWLALMGMTCISLLVMYFSRSLKIRQSIILVSCYIVFVGFVLFLEFPME
jgi:cation:H+ antiporter